MKRTMIVLFLLSAVGLMAYSNSFKAPFQFDGNRQIAENPMIRSLNNFAPALEGHAPHPTEGSVYNNRRIIGYLTLALNYRMGGLDVAGYHVVNLAVHVINGFLVYLLLILTFKTPYFSDKLLAISDKRSASGNNPPSSPLSLRGDRGGGRSAKLRGDEGGGRFTAHGSRPFSDPRTLIAIFAALLFVVHPIETQAVTYIVQRFTSLAAMFFLLSIVMYANGRLSIRPAGRLASFFFSLLSAILAMLTKEIAFTLPVIIVLYEFFFFKSSLRKRLLFLLPVLLTLLVIPISVMGTHKPLGELLSDLSAKTRVQTNIPRWDYLMTQMRVITTYIRLLFLPVNQNLDYDYPIYHSFFSPPVFLSFLFLMAIFGTGVYLFYRSREHGATNKDQVQPHGAEGGTPPSSPLNLRGDEGGVPFTIHALRLIAFGILWFFITLSVTSSVIPIADVIFEHRVYLPSVGAFIAISSAVFLLAGKIRRRSLFGRTATYALSAVLIILLAGATYARNTVWRNPVSLWEDVLQKSPGNARAYNDLGYLYLTGGQTDKSIEYFRHALRIMPHYSNAHTNLGVAYYSKGWTDAAVMEFKAALASAPHGPDVAEDHHNLGIAFTRKGMPDEAISEYLAALKLAPRDAGIYNDLGVAYRQKGDIDKAIASFRRAVALKPGYAGAHYNLGLACEAAGLKVEAEAHLREAHNLDPGRF